MVKKEGEFRADRLDNALVREIQWLRKGEGVTLRRISAVPTLLQLASKEAGPGPERDEQGIHAAEQLLRRGLDSLGNGLGARALRAALAIDCDEPLTLTQRRCDFAEQYGRHPDTVETHENRAIHELALRIRLLAEASRGLEEVPPPMGGAAVVPMGLRLLRSNDELVAALLRVVEEAEHCLVATGSRSRDERYLEAIEKKVESTAIVHYRVLCGPPHWAVFRSHLARLLDIKSRFAIAGNPRMFIGMMADLVREPERSLCANERRAVVVLPSLNGRERYDTALDLGGDEYGIGYTRLVQEMYAASQPLERVEEVLALPVLRE
jgi:hypothetical protein